MSKIRKLIGGGKIFFCPGCKSAHVINSHPDAPRWVYDGNENQPTISPSILVTYDSSDAGKGDAPPARCHLFVRAGMIEFLGDCTHELAGKTVAVPEWPHAPGTYGGIDEPGAAQ